MCWMRSPRTAAPSYPSGLGQLKDLRWEMRPGGREVAFENAGRLRAEKTFELLACGSRKVVYSR